MLRKTGVFSCFRHWIGIDKSYAIKKSQKHAYLHVYYTPFLPTHVLEFKECFIIFLKMNTSHNKKFTMQADQTKRPYALTSWGTVLFIAAVPAVFLAVTAPAAVDTLVTVSTRPLVWRTAGGVTVDLVWPVHAVVATVTHGAHRDTLGLVLGTVEFLRTTGFYSKMKRVYMLKSALNSIVNLYTCMYSIW